ncbi:MAG: hypothetical protein ACXWT0_01705 [Methylobacter sp.]
MEDEKKQDDLVIPDGTYSTRGGQGNFGVHGRERKRYKKNKRLTEHQWGELLGLLMTGHYTQKDLAAQYGVSETSIIAKRKKLGGIKIGQSSTTKSSLEAIDKTAQALIGAMGFSTEEAGRLITEAKRRTFQRNEALGKVATNILNEAYKTKKIDSAKDTIKVLLDFQTFFEKEFRLTGLCLGFEDGKFDTANDAPILTIAKMTDEDIAIEQARLGEGDELYDALDIDEGDYSETGE